MQHLTGADWQTLTGQSTATLAPVCDGASLMLHKDVLPYWRELRQQAANAGFDLQIASAWRGFDRQRLIWNGKATGERQVMDDAGVPINTSALSEDQLLFAMLRWSAIPGCSRHHWGTDLDIFDGAAVTQDYALQLIASECEGTGPFAALHRWLDDFFKREDAGFCRPYSRDHGGIAPERWHISCRPVAEYFDALLDEKRLLEWIMHQDIALKDRIYCHWHDIFQRYVRVRYDVRL